MISTSTPRQRRRSTSRKSRTAAPVGLVTNASRRGNAGSLRFARRIEQPFGRQLLAQLPQRQLQRADALRLQLVDDQLIAAARRVHIEMAVADDVEPVGQIELQLRRRAAPHHGANLGLVVLEREIRVARLRPRVSSRSRPRPTRWETRLRARFLIWAVSCGDGERLLGSRGEWRHGTSAAEAASAKASDARLRTSRIKIPICGRARRFAIAHASARRVRVAASEVAMRHDSMRRCGRALRRIDDFARFARAGGGPGFGFARQAIEQSLDALAAVLQAVAIQDPAAACIGGPMTARARENGRGTAKRSQLLARQGRS